MSSFAEAVAAKDRLLARVGRPTWFVGIGVGQDESGCVIRLTVTREAPSDLLPSEVDGVRVVLIRSSGVVAF